MSLLATQLPRGFEQLVFVLGVSGVWGCWGYGLRAEAFARLGDSSGGRFPLRSFATEVSLVFVAGHACCLGRVS